MRRIVFIFLPVTMMLTYSIITIYKINCCDDKASGFFSTFDPVDKITVARNGPEESCCKL